MRDNNRTNGAAWRSGRVRAAGLILALMPIMGSGAMTERRELAFGDRVACQLAVEAVYYSHQEGATRSFEDAVTEELVRRRVRTSLKQSVALEELWGTPVTASMLEAELNRIRTASHFPKRLAEVEEALGHDLVLVQECFARPVVVERLIRNFYDFDERVHGEARQQAEELRTRLLERQLRPQEQHPLRSERKHKTVALAPSQFDSGVAGSTGVEVGDIRQEADAFVFDVPIPQDPGTTARYRVPKKPWEEWWSAVQDDFDERRTVTVASTEGLLRHRAATSGDQTCLPDDTWDNGSLAVEPSWTKGPGVWTGTHMLVGGGQGGGPVLKYDPLTDTWTRSAIPSPVNQVRHTAVWTGSVLIVWGGGPAGVNTGGRYDPVADTWQPTSLVNAPSPRWGHSAVWTGSRMIIWGGSGTNTGGVYDPVSDTWTPTSIPGFLEPRLGHSAVWTGSEMIVWGGHVPRNVFSTGGRYNPTTDSWAPMSLQGVPQKRTYHTAIWTGSEMIVWGGSEADALDTGSKYNPALDSWQTISTVGAPMGRFNHTALWTGREMVVWGGEIYYGGATGGGRYDPLTDTWRSISAINEPDPRMDYASVWTGDRMVVFGGMDPSPFVTRALFTGSRYDPAHDIWSPTSSTANSPAPRAGHKAVWTGNEMIVWGGCDLFYNAFASGGRYDPLTDSWRSTSILGAPEGRCGQGMVWTGDEMLLWGGDHRIFNESKVLSTGGRYDPVTDTWRTMSEAGAPQARTNLSAIWTGDRMIVWGGDGLGASRTLATGSIYDPVSDGWRPMTTAGAPEPRYFHDAIWTGERMVVWGGDTGTGRASYGTGGRYDPATDTWQPVSMVGSPGPRVAQATVWTGREMFVFAGAECMISCPPLASGGLYDPQLDTWRPVSSVGAPPPRLAPTEIWTGREVLMWDTPGGGRYDPVTDSWRPMSSQDAPSGYTGAIRSVWTGTHMIVYGGSGYGGRYIASYGRDDDADGYTACGGDCNDAEPETHPGAAEVCDGLDNDCDGTVPAVEMDLDGDGFMVRAGDCDDADEFVNPDAVELPGNAADENCDGVLACDPRAPWKNRGQLVACVARACVSLVEGGAVSREECDLLVARSARLLPR